MVAKFHQKQNNPWNIWNNYTRYSVKRKSGLLNTVLIQVFPMKKLDYICISVLDLSTYANIWRFITSKIKRK